MTGFGPTDPEGIKANAASVVQRRRLVRQREVSQFYVRRLLRNQLVPVGQQGTGAPATESVEKVVLQKDHLNVVGNHGAQSPGSLEVEVTRDADGGMRMWATGGGGGGVSDGDKGDITVSGGGTTWTIDAGVVTTTKMGGDVTSAGKALLDDATSADQRTTLGLGTAATQASSAFAAASHTHVASDITNGEDARIAVLLLL